MTKTNRRIVSDASAIITLERVTTLQTEHCTNGADLLRLYFKKVLVPEVTMHEIYRKNFSSASDYLDHYELTDIVTVAPVEADSDLPFLHRYKDKKRPPLYKGEIYAISLARNEQLPILLDDTDPAKDAFSMGLKVSNMGYETVRAYRNGLLSKKDAEYIIAALAHARAYSSTVCTQILGLLNTS